jgi:hypothetical protein
VSDWDEDSKQSRDNLLQTLSSIRDDAFQRIMPTVEAARRWHISIMDGLTTPAKEYVGRFRGEPGLENIEIEVGGELGVISDQVEEELRVFEEKLLKMVALLDRDIQPDQDMTADHVAAAIDLCAWVHAEWIRIHPFANGNGRMARLWANSMAMRYGLPPFVRLRPRPDGGYGAAANAAMRDHWRSTVPVFRLMYREFIRR